MDVSHFNRNLSLYYTLMNNTSAASAVLIYDQWYCNNKRHLNTADYITSYDNTDLPFCIASY